MTTPSTYRKKPVVIEAMQLLDDLSVHIAIAKWVTDNGGVAVVPPLAPHLFIRTLEGDMRADLGDWIIRGTKGEFYPCKPDVFADVYEVVADRTGSSSRAHAERLAELRALADAATPTPWREPEHIEAELGYMIMNTQVGMREHAVAFVSEIWNREMAEANAALIVAAVNALPELLAEVERLRTELSRFEGNAEILSASTVGEAFDRIEQTIRERDEARAELAKAREAGETHKTTADVMTLAVKRRNEETNALRTRVRYVADSVAGGPDWGSLIADQIRAALDGKHARIEDAEGVARCLLCRAEWPCRNQSAPSAVEAASTPPADAVTALRDAGILACGTGRTSDDVRESEVAP